VPETPAPDPGSAESITLIVHGVGTATDKQLLAAAAKGYVASGLSGRLEPLTLADCPVLCRRRNGAEGFTLHAPDGTHLLIALPWADRRIRLSAIARWAAIALTVLTALAAGAFFLREPLDALTDWLRPWSHRALAYGYLLMIGWMWSARTQGESAGQFYPSLGFILTLPPLLGLIGAEFLDATWLWIPIALLVIVLWLVPAVTVMRCCRIAPTLKWQLALAALVVALALPAAPLVRLANKFAEQATAARRAEAESLLHSGGRAVPLPRGGTEPQSNPTVDSNSRVPTLPEPGPADVPQSGAPQRADDGSAPRSGEPSPITLGDVHVERPWVLPPSPPLTQPPVDGRSDDPPFGVNDETILDILEGKGRLGATLPTFQQSTATAKAVREWLARRLEQIAFPIQVRLAVLMLVLCVSTMAISWFVDFGMDVLAYGGHARHRAALVDGTLKTVLWLHARHPHAQIVLVGHSLGSVIVAHAITALSSLEPRPRRLVLVTLGSPLNYLSRLFPSSVHGSRELSDTLAGRARWINLWRRNDPIGKALDIGTKEAVQYCVGKGGHANYWCDGAVWRAVAQEALPSDTEHGLIERPDTGVGSCVLERRLGLLLLSTIAALALFGVIIWIFT